MSSYDTRYPSMYIHQWLMENSGFYGSDYGKEALYNVDMAPLQNPVLRYNWTDTMNPFHREKLYQYSPYLRQVTVEQIHELVKDGWEYEDINEGNEENEEEESNGQDDSGNMGSNDGPVLQKNGKDSKKPESENKPKEEKNWEHKEGILESFTSYSEIPEWCEELGYQAAECTGIGMVVDTAFLLIMSDSLYEDELIFIPVSRNYLKDGKAIGNENRQIKKIKIVFPDLPDLTDENGSPFIEKTEDFYTQYAKRDKEINAVVVQPLRSQESPFGRPYALREIQTAYEKMYLRFYEMLYLHKGGVLSESYALPNNVTDRLIAQTKKEITRGMLGQGYVITLPKSIKLSDSFQHNAVQMQKLDTAFDKISTHINEDSILSKSKVGGDTGSGFAGLQPVQSSMDDKSVKEKCGIIFEKVIKDINYVLYGVDPRSYRVKFNEPESLGNQFNETNQDVRDEETRLGRKIEYGRKGDPKSLAKAAGKGSGEQIRK